MIRIENALHPDHVCFDLKAQDKTSAIRELAETLRGDSRVRDIDALLEDVFQREQKASTSIGNGLAIPHARSGQVTGLCLAAAIFRDGIAQEAGEPLRFIILAAVPHALAAEYLRILGSLARVFTNEKNAELLMNSESPEEFIETLEKLSQKL